MNENDDWRAALFEGVPQPEMHGAGGRTVVLSAQGLQHAYLQVDRQVKVLDGIDLQVHEGEMVAIVGASGSGKSTLLHMLGGLDEPAVGTVMLGDRPLAALTEAERGALRNRRLGFVYQFHHLLAEFSALENVAMPLLIRGMARAEMRQRAERMLAMVGLAERLEHRPGELSGGERQRVALARALVTEPDCVLADEPTGNLDRETARQMFALLLRLTREMRTAVLVVTHDLELAAAADRQWAMRDGRLERIVMSAIEREQLGLDGDGPGWRTVVEPDAD